MRDASGEEGSPQTKPSLRFSTRSRMEEVRGVSGSGGGPCLGVCSSHCIQGPARAELLKPLKITLQKTQGLKAGQKRKRGSLVDLSSLRGAQARGRAWGRKRMWHWLGGSQVCEATQRSHGLPEEATLRSEFTVGNSYLLGSPGWVPGPSFPLSQTYQVSWLGGPQGVPMDPAAPGSSRQAGRQPAHCLLPKASAIPSLCLGRQGWLRNFSTPTLERADGGNTLHKKKLRLQRSQRHLLQAGRGGQLKLSHGVQHPCFFENKEDVGLTSGDRDRIRERRTDRLGVGRERKGAFCK